MNAIRRYAALHAVWFICFGIFSGILAQDEFIVGNVRVQLLSPTLVRLEQKGPKGFEDRKTYTVLNREWPGT